MLSVENTARHVNAVVNVMKYLRMLEGSRLSLENRYSCLGCRWVYAPSGAASSPTS